MAMKKSEIYSSLWKSCDELRGGMDTSQYKDYVLVLLFVKYVSDKYAGQPRALIEVPEGGSFSDMVALKGDKEIGDKMNKIIDKLAEANNLKGVIDVADFNDADKLGKGREMQDRLSNLVAIFDNPALNFRKSRADGNNIFSDAYEYLMSHFATESGKSKGQFYTPSEVSLIMAKVIGIDKASSQSQTIYDPTCGSGSLLLKATNESETSLAIYGQEMDNAAAALAKMNMILHDHPTAEIWQDNSLSTPYFTDPHGSLKMFDFVVANPPFSKRAWSNGFDPLNDLYERFVDGVPPAQNGDYAFLLHIIHSLKSSGRGAIILPYGILFRGNAEADIRKNIIQKGYIKGIIGLPANLFYGTGIPACIIILDKNDAANRRSIFMIDASKGFMKDGSKNRLRHQDIHKIVDVFNKQIELPEYSRLVSIVEIEEKGYNLNIPVYFTIYTQPVTTLFERWKKNNISNLKSFDRGSRPKQLISTLSEDLLQTFSATTLIDKYDVYQHLMNYWSETMQDDLHMIAIDGWKANNNLIPPQLIVNRYFTVEQQAIEQLQVVCETIARKIEEINEKYSNQERLLEKAKNARGKVTKANIKARLKDIFATSDPGDEHKLLNMYLDLFEQKDDVKKKAKDAQKKLDAKVNTKYGQLSEDEIKTLVVEDKWLMVLAINVQSELNYASAVPSQTVEELEIRSITPLLKRSEDINILKNAEEQRSNSTSVVKIFYCYAHEDKGLRDQLDKHMGSLRRSGKIVTWHDREILAGAEWEHEIDRHLNASKIVLLLVSPDFIHSDYCYGVEMQRALRMHDRNIARIIPIILRPVNWQETPLRKLQVVPLDGKPVTTWGNLDEALQSVVMEIQKVVDLFLEHNNG